MVKVKTLSPFAQRTIAIVKAIPKGKVLTYADVANFIGRPGAARQISYILHSSSKKHKLPWHRVVSSQGKISRHGGALKQRALLKKEGLDFDREYFDLEAHRWRPTKKKLTALVKKIPDPQARS